MFNRKTMISITAIGLLAIGISAQADFKSTSTGTGVAANDAPALCVGNPATNSPCVVTSDALEYGSVASLKTKAAAGTLTKAEVEADFSVPDGVNLNNAHALKYVRSKLNAAINNGNTPNPKKISDLQTHITSATPANVGLWAICQRVAGVTTIQADQQAFNDAGISTTITTDTGYTADYAGLDAALSSSGISCPTDSTTVENWITTLAGFDASVTYADLESALSPGNWTTANYKAASAKGYTNSASDKTLYDEAAGSSYTASCTAEVTTATSCTDLTKAQFASAKAGSALFALKKAKAIAGTLVLADLTELNLTVTTLGTPSTSQMNYLMSQLDKNSGATKAGWQTTITAYTTANAALWLIGELAAGTETDTSLATKTLFATAGASSTYSNAVTDALIATNVASSSLTSSSTGTQMNNWLVSILGFTNSDIFTAWSKAGHTTSSFPVATFESCYNSTATGANACAISNTSWTNLSPLLASPSSGITTAQLQTYFGSIGVTNAAFGTTNLSSLTTTEAGYLRDCISALTSKTSTNINACANTTNATASSIGLHVCSGVRSGTYADSKITADVLEDIGVFSNAQYSKAIFNGNYCGNAGVSDKSCMKIALNRIKTGSNPCGAATTLKSNLCFAVKEKVRDFIVGGKHFAKRIAVEACQKVTLTNALSAANFAPAGMPNFRDMYSFDGSPMKGTKHSSHSPSASYSHPDNMLGIKQSGDNLEIYIAGNPAGRRSRQYRFVTRYNGDSCIPAYNYYGNPHGNTMIHKFTISVLEDAADTANNTLTWTESNVRPARSCSACQGSSPPDWCSDVALNRISGYSNHKYAACPNKFVGHYQGSTGTNAKYTSENGGGWEPASGTYGPQTTSYHMHTATAPSSMPALRTVSNCD